MGDHQEIDLYGHRHSKVCAKHKDELCESCDRMQDSCKLCEVCDNLICNKCDSIAKLESQSQSVMTFEVDQCDLDHLKIANDTLTDGGYGGIRYDNATSVVSLDLN